MSDHFVMLWGDMLNSTINDHPPAVWKLFTVCLLLCDKEGCFRASVGALARQSNMEISEVLESLRVLEGPDPDSTSPEESGARLVSMGQNKWLVVNYATYRNRQAKELKRAKWAADKRRQRSEVDSNGQDETPVDTGGQEVDGGGRSVDPVRVCVDVPVDVPVSPKREKKKRSVFKKPLLADVVSYLDEKGETRIDPSSFLDFYESKGWMVGKNPMKDWKAAMRQWIRARDEGHVKQGGVDMHVGANPKKALVEATDEELEILVKHIMKHAVHLAMLEGLTEDQAVIVRSAAEELQALADSDMAKGLMEQKFYTIHDQMMKMLFNTLSETEDAELQADFPGGGINFDVWVRKCLQEQFKINDPLEYDLEGA